MTERRKKERKKDGEIPLGPHIHDDIDDGPYIPSIDMDEEEIDIMLKENAVNSMEEKKEENSKPISTERVQEMINILDNPDDDLLDRVIAGKESEETKPQTSIEALFESLSHDEKYHDMIDSDMEAIRESVNRIGKGLENLKSIKECTHEFIILKKVPDHVVCVHCDRVYPLHRIK
jgi:succinate dehydrogenase flavin-adding protein (antitoxin of CptAB toxin-antitoxin module)